MKKLLLCLISLMLILSACIDDLQGSQPPPIETPAAPITNAGEPDVTSADEKELESESNSELEPELLSANEVASEQEHIDIQYLLGTGDTAPHFDEVRHILGEPIEYGHFEQRSIPYYFENGLIASRLNVSSNMDAPIVDITVDYRQASNLSAFHFNGIDGTSTYDDVVALFGNEPHHVGIQEFDGDNEYRRGAVKSYGYWTHEGRFVRFFFDDRNNVVGISFFIPN